MLPIKKDGETPFQYKIRVCLSKLNQEIQDDWQDIVNELGLNEHYDSLRKKAYGYKEVCDNLSEIIEQDKGSCIDEKLLELQKERYRFFDQRNELNKIIRESARFDEIKEIVRRAALAEKPILNYKTKEIAYDKSDLVVPLNDLHFGAQVKNRWNEYNEDVCIERLNKYLDKILLVQKMHCCKNCVILANGDQISGAIHQSIAVSNKENVLKQTMGVAEVIANFIIALANSGEFETIKFASVAGNHSRIGKKDEVSKDERLDDLIEWWLEARLQNYHNVVFQGYDKIDDTLYSIDICGKKYVGVHGDYDRGLEKIMSLQTMVGEKIYCVISGHLHHNKLDEYQGIKTLMSGSMMGMDDFCIEKRIFGVAEQMPFVANESGILCAYPTVLQ